MSWCFIYVLKCQQKKSFLNMWWKFLLSNKMRVSGFLASFLKRVSKYFLIHQKPGWRSLNTPTTRYFYKKLGFLSWESQNGQKVRKLAKKPETLIFFDSKNFHHMLRKLFFCWHFITYIKHQLILNNPLIEKMEPQSLNQFLKH